jgi:hypothetical protein
MEIETGDMEMGFVASRLSGRVIQCIIRVHQTLGHGHQTLGAGFLESVHTDFAESRSDVIPRSPCDALMLRYRPDPPISLERS